MVRLVHFLANRGWAFERILASGPYDALLAWDSAAGRRTVVIVLDTAGSIRWIGDLALDLTQFLPTSVTWVVLDGDPVLEVTFDDRAESVVVTVLTRVHADRLERVFLDDGDACRPARLWDLDGDGRLELVSYAENATRDCTHPCIMDLQHHFNLLPAWLTIHRWEGGTWRSVEAEFPSYYAALGDQYARVDAWLRSGGSDAEACQGVSWLTRSSFTDWAARARRLAAQKE
jgi:hypothetical protein